MPETKDLAEILSKRDAVKYKAIIDRAANNGYHDFKFDSIPGHPEYAECNCPKMQLVADLEQFPELSDIAKEVCTGKYDEHPDASDDFRMRASLMDDDCPDFMFEMIGLKPPTVQERLEWKNKKQLN